MKMPLSGSPDAADVVKLVNTRDLKSLALTGLRVQVPSSAPKNQDTIVRMKSVGNSTDPVVVCSVNHTNC